MYLSFHKRSYCIKNILCSLLWTCIFVSATHNWMPQVKKMFFVLSEVILYLQIWYFLCTFLQSNRRFTFNWTAMFVVTLSQWITNTCHITHNVHRRRSCQHPPPRPKYSPLRHLTTFSHRAVSYTVTPCSADNGYRRFESIYIPYFQR